MSNLNFDIYKLKRMLAKSTTWQILYNQAKELRFSLFNNDKDFTKLQLSFMNDLSFYTNLSMDIAMGEVSKKVMDDLLYENAYTTYKQNKRMNKVEATALPTEANVTKWNFKIPK